MRPELWGDEKRGERRIKTEHAVTFRLAGRDEVKFGG